MHASLYQRKQWIDRTMSMVIGVLTFLLLVCYMRFIQENEKVELLQRQLNSLESNCDPLMENLLN